MSQINEQTPAVETNEFAVKPITPLFWKYSLFGLAGLILQACSVVADGIFVGDVIGPMGIATIGIIASLWTIAIALMALFGIGGATVIAAKLGEGDEEGARQTYAAVTIFSFIVSIILAVWALFNVNNILTFLGATPDILPYARDYAIPYFIVIPFCITGGAVYYYTRAVGKPAAGTVAYSIPAILCITLEYIFLYKMDFGMEASSITWGVCVGLSFPLIFYLQAVKGGLKIKLSDFKIRFDLVWSTIKVGFTPFVIQLVIILTTVIVNRQIINYGGSDLDIAAFATINAYIIYILTLLCNSLISGLLPIASFNYGMGTYSRVKELLKKASIQSFIALTALLAVIFIFANPIVSFFVGSDTALVEQTIRIMKYFLPLYTFGFLALITSSYFQALELNKEAMISGLSRVIFSTPLLFILPKFFAFDGIWYAQPVSDLLAFILSMIMIVRESRRLDRMQNK